MFGCCKINTDQVGSLPLYNAREVALQAAMCLRLFHGCFDMYMLYEQPDHVWLL